MSIKNLFDKDCNISDNPHAQILLNNQINLSVNMKIILIF